MPAPSHRSEVRPRTWQILLAFAIIYFVWGSTFLAIRIGVAEVPPFLLAGLRFLIAGGVLFLWMRARGTPSPTMREWSATVTIALLIFVLDYGMLFWAEKRVPSGLAAVMLATIPVFMALSEITLLRTQQLTVRLALALLIGIAGVGVLVSPTVRFGEVAINPAGAAALLLAAVSWSIASILTRKLPLPKAKVMSSGAQMLAGGILLLVVASLLGEFRRFNFAEVSARAWWALAYLTIAGSIIGFTAYVWLLHHESPTKVGTYAYVNPVVAVLLGYFVAGEPLGPRTIIGTLCVLTSVILITIAPARKRLLEEIPRTADKVAS